jgi:hypothetical protein
MARSNYHIAYVERGKEPLWRRYWVTGERDDEVVEAHAAGDLGKVEYLEAATLEDAIRQVQAKHPDCSVMRDGSGRMGDAR